jgi:two-component system response regulator
MSPSAHFAANSAIDGTIPRITEVFPMKSSDENPMNKPVRVLLIEDDMDDSDLLARQLHKNNFEGHVKVIPDGKQAWNFLRAEDSCASLIAIFLDLNLPSLSGVKLLRRIKSRGELCAIPIFVITSSNLPKDLDECSHLGVDGYINKPVTYLAFAKAVADLFHSPVLRAI